MSEELSHDLDNLKVSSQLLEEWTDRKNVLKSIEEKEVWWPPLKNSGGEEPHRNVSITPENNVGGIQQLKIGEWATGKIFICRTITPSIQNVGGIGIVEAAVEDLDFNAVRLILQNFITGQEVIPQGTILVVKNPSLRILKGPGEGSQRIGIYSGNIANVEIISYKKFHRMFPDHSWTPESSEVWSGTDAEIRMKLKRLGNKCFIAKSSPAALRYYDLSLEYLTEDEEERTNVILNKAAAYLQMELYAMALKCAQIVLQRDEDDIKAIFRLGKALLGLGKYEEAVQFLQNKFKTFPELMKEKDLNMLRTNSEVFMKAKRDGEIGEPELLPMVAAYLKDEEIIDTTKIAEITGPIKISLVEGKGRGFIATEDIPPGSLILSEKAFGFFQPLKSSIKPTFIERMNSRKQKHSEIIQEIANKLKFDPELAENFYELHSGVEQERNEDNSVVNLDRIGWIILYNQFRVSTHKDVEEDGCGLWILGSYFNHSCSEANANWIIYGNLMVIRAGAEGIQKGKEVLISYISPAKSFKERQVNFISHGFTCTCKLCTLEGSENPKIVSERVEILDWFERNSQVGFHPQSKIKEGVKKLQKLLEQRDKNVILNPCLKFDSITILIEAFYNTGRLLECLKWLKKTEEGVEHFPGLLTCTFNIQVNILRCQIDLARDKKEVKKTVKKVKTTLKCLYGTLNAAEYTGLMDTLELVKFYLGKDFFAND